MENSTLCLQNLKSVIISFPWTSAAHFLPPLTLKKTIWNISSSYTSLMGNSRLYHFSAFQIYSSFIQVFFFIFLKSCKWIFFSIGFRPLISFCSSFIRTFFFIQNPTENHLKLFERFFFFWKVQIWPLLWLG